MNPIEIEKLVSFKLGEMFGIRFKKGKLLVGHDSKKRPRIHEFDLISEDMKIVGEVKSGKCSRRNFSLALVDCFYLSKVEAQTKLMVFTDRELYEYFKDNSEGLISNNISTIFVVPSTHLQKISS